MVYGLKTFREFRWSTFKIILLHMKPSPTVDSLLILPWDGTFLPWDGTFLPWDGTFLPRGSSGPGQWVRVLWYVNLTNRKERKKNSLFFLSSSSAIRFFFASSRCFLIRARRARSARASSVLPAEWSFSYRAFAFCFSISSLEKKWRWDTKLWS